MGSAFQETFCSSSVSCTEDYSVLRNIVTTICGSANVSSCPKILYIKWFYIENWRFHSTSTRFTAECSETCITIVFKRNSSLDTTIYWVLMFVVYPCFDCIDQRILIRFLLLWIVFLVHNRGNWILIVLSPGKRTQKGRKRWYCEQLLVGALRAT